VSFPEHIDRVLIAYGIRADTKAALYELYISMGAEVLEVFADLADGVASAAALQPEDTTRIREAVVERHLRRNHPLWLEGRPTGSLWHPRDAEGRASGAALPLGEIPEEVRNLVGRDQPVPDGVLILGRNAHLGGRAETISFDVVAREFDDALALARAAGQQHTIPGSAGETSGTYDSARNVALIWEVQPNVYKPGEGRNREIAKVYRHHRNWHVVTLAAAIQWLRVQRATIYVLRGDILRLTHEVNPTKPLSAKIVGLHDRTVRAVAAALGVELLEATGEDELVLLDSCVMNHALRRYVLEHGADAAVWRIGV
jgi:hypothetical protein